MRKCWKSLWLCLIIDWKLTTLWKVKSNPKYMWRDQARLQVIRKNMRNMRGQQKKKSIYRLKNLISCWRRDFSAWKTTIAIRKRWSNTSLNAKIYLSYRACIVALEKTIIHSVWPSNKYMGNLIDSHQLRWRPYSRKIRISLKNQSWCSKVAIIQMSK